MRKKYLLLPDIRSCHNVGAMFRTADAFGFNKLFLVGYTAHPPKIQIDKVSLGAETWVPWEACESLEELIQRLKGEGVEIIALEKNEQSVDIHTYTPAADFAIIVGNEVDGIAEEICAQVDAVVHIPMQGKKESLNVSIAAGVAMNVLGRA